MNDLHKTFQTNPINCTGYASDFMARAESFPTGLRGKTLLHFSVVDLIEKVIPVQHHFAHVVSCKAENHIDDTVIGVAFDGTGYGTDGNIWGAASLVLWQNYKNSSTKNR
ncbi:hypothetical protein KF913_16490 [Candidatus Obscuribacterales bacterium]|nr:hypothetical protein [Candidatus Obscuribacterales bacterium]